VTSGPGTDESPAVTRPRMFARQKLLTWCPRSSARRVRNPARGQSPRQDRSISRNRVDRIFDGRSSPEVASNHILDWMNRSPDENGRGRDRLVERHAGRTITETCIVARRGD
jgi:hypothetical protein